MKAKHIVENEFADQPGVVAASIVDVASKLRDEYASYGVTVQKDSTFISICRKGESIANIELTRSGRYRTIVKYPSGNYESDNWTDPKDAYKAVKTVLDKYES